MTFCTSTGKVKHKTSKVIWILLTSMFSTLLSKAGMTSPMGKKEAFKCQIWQKNKSLF